MTEWWEDFFDADYHRLWGQWTGPERTEAEVEGIWRLLGLKEGSRILDAPCGYGRIARPLAERGASVLGVDQSQVLLAQAEAERGDIDKDKLGYRRHDLRTPLAENGFDAAINVYSSLGYGSEDGDISILSTLRKALRPGGLVFVETNHRDAASVHFARSGRLGSRLDDGTLMVEEPIFDPIRGRVETTWYWSGPRGSGQKSASLRLYSATELVSLLERAGFRFRSAHRGCSVESFRLEATDMGGRIGLLAERPE